jgi:uncharacterized protein (TIGR03437 family)
MYVYLNPGRQNVNLGRHSGITAFLVLFAVLQACGVRLAAQPYLISTVAGGAPIPTPIAAASASIGGPQAVAVGPSGDLFFSGYGASIYKLDSQGMVTRVAGTGKPGYSGDNGPATSVCLSGEPGISSQPTPAGLALDSSGNLYIADGINHRVRRVSPAGVISTVAGSGTSGFSGDGGPAIQAQLNNPNGVAVDQAGNLYIADTENHVIRKVAPDGTISTAVGFGVWPGFNGDGGPATQATLNTPNGVAVDSAGNLYIADTKNYRIRKVAPSGVITTVAGNGSSVYSGDGGLATSAGLGSPRSVAMEAAGSLLITDTTHFRVRRLSSNGTISTVAGTGISDYSGDGGPAINARIGNPVSVAADSAGGFYFADQAHFRVRKVSAAGIISTAAGNGRYGYSGEGVNATLAQLYWPTGVAVDGAGNLLIADLNNHRIRQVSSGGTIATVAGSGWGSSDSFGGYSGDGGLATKALLNHPSDIAVDGSAFYIADQTNCVVRRVGADGIISTAAGTGFCGYSGDGGPATSAAFSTLNDIVADGRGTVFVSSSDHRVRKISGGTVSTVAGDGTPGFSGDGGLARNARMTSPRGMAVGPDGALYIADTGNNRIRKIAVDGTITTVAGSSSQADVLFGGDGGVATAARLYVPEGVAVDGSGNLYIADIGNHRIRKVSASGIITTIAGVGTGGYSGDGGEASAAQFDSPMAVALDAAGDVFVADSGNNAVRMLRPAVAGPVLNAVTNGASNLVGSVAPGEIVVLYGSGMGPSPLVQAQADSSGFFGTALAGTRVLVNDIPAAIIYTSPTQVSAVIPYDITGSSARVQVEYRGVKLASVNVPIAASAPALFTANSSGTGQVAALNEDSSVNSSALPAKSGSIIQLFGTGEGQTSPRGIDGKTADVPFPAPLLLVRVWIDGKLTTTTYTGAAPYMIAGLIQINAVIPAGTPGGDVAVMFEVGGVSSPPGTTIRVGN